MTNQNNKKVFVGMSGGVDSSVTAYLLKEQGYEVTGVFMRSYNIDGCQERDAEDARRVAEKIGIPFYIWDFEEEYKRLVVDYMIEGYRNGLTPNPDVMCNKEIKFGLFFKRAMEAGADYVATGHYVRKISFNLAEAKDKNKDQSYFLWTLGQNEIKHSLFPIGDYLKSEVREIARRAGLPTAEKKDSQGICFLGQVTIADFLKQYIPEQEGRVVTTEGQEIGRHSGAYFYTIGQRHGLKLDKKNQALGIQNTSVTKPHYIAAKDVETNTITVAAGDTHPALFAQEAELYNVNVEVSELSTPAVFVRVRYRQPLSPAELKKVDSGWRVIFKNPQKFVASGQSAVFYNKEGKMLGGGIIK